MANTKKFTESVALAVNTEREKRDRLTKIAAEKKISRADLVGNIIDDYFKDLDTYETTI